MNLDVVGDLAFAAGVPFEKLLDRLKDGILDMIIITVYLTPTGGEYHVDTLHQIDIDAGKI